MKYQINDLYQSIQGEGSNTGLDVIFVRLSKCNLACSFCDTEFNSVKYEMAPGEVVLYCKEQFPDCKNILLTGGEPFMRDLQPLCKEFKRHGYWIGAETNGMFDVSSYRYTSESQREKLVDYITCAPKTPCDQIKARQVEEVRVPVAHWVTAQHLEDFQYYIGAWQYYLSPIEIDGKFDLQPVYTLLRQANKDSIKWKVSIQTHKLANIP